MGDALPDICGQRVSKQTMNIAQYAWRLSVLFQRMVQPLVPGHSSSPESERRCQDRIAAVCTGLSRLTVAGRSAGLIGACESICRGSVPERENGRLNGLEPDV